MRTNSPVTLPVGKNLPEVCEIHVIINDQKKLSTYHNHLKSLGFHPSYSPTAGTTWKLKR